MISRKACVGALAASSIIASGVLVWLVSGALAPRQVPQVRASAIVTPGNSQQSLFANDPNTTRVEMQQLSESWLKNAQQAGEAKAP